MRVRTVNSQAGDLIKVLLDEKAEYGDRHDAAMDLGAFDGKEAEAALAQVGCNSDADEDLADACGESLAEMWLRAGNINEAVLVRLVPASLRIALATLRARSPILAAQAEGFLSSGV